MAIVHHCSPPSPAAISGKQNTQLQVEWRVDGPQHSMRSFQIESSNRKGGDWDARMVHKDDEQDRLVIKNRERKQAEQDMERQNYWEKEYPTIMSTQSF